MAKFIAEPTLDLTIHTTGDCNFACSYCYMDKESLIPSEDVQIAICNFIKKNIRAYSSVRMSWFGGEPMLEMGVIERLSKEIISVCTKMKKPYAAGITTNGYFLTKDNVQTLISSRVSSVTVSIDGIGESHDQYRMLKDGSPTFEKIIDNLIYIKTNVPSRRLYIVIRINITKKHLNHMKDIFTYFDNLFGDDDRFSLFIRPVEDYGGDRVKSLVSDFVSTDDLCRCYEMLAERDYRIKLHANIHDYEFGGGFCAGKKFNSFTVDCNGYIHKCDEVLTNPIGKLNRNGHMDINLNDHAKWVTPISHSDCNECFHSGVCFMDCCPRQRVETNQSGCHFDDRELDSLVWLTAKKFNVKTI